jgi:hypothetical protein
MDFPPFENGFFGDEGVPSQDLSGRSQFDHGLDDAPAR